MHARQSTMFKSLKVFGIFLAAVIAVAHCQSNESNETSESDSSETGLLPTASGVVSSTGGVLELLINLMRTGLLEGILDILDDSFVGFVFRPLNIILRPIFFLVDTILSPVFWTVSEILSPISFLVNFILSPITGILGVVFQVVNGVFSLVGNLLGYLLSDASGNLAEALAHISDQSNPRLRNRRAIVDTLTGMVSSSLPYRFVSSYVGPILSPLRFLYNLVLWPIYYLLGADTSTLNVYPDLSLVQALVASYLLKLSQSSQAALIELLGAGWAFSKSTILPALDELLVNMQTADFVSDELRPWLKSLHYSYSMMKMFGIV